MKRTLSLLLAATCMVGIASSATTAAFAETPAAQFKIKKKDPPPPPPANPGNVKAPNANLKPVPAFPAAGNFQAATLMKCENGFSQAGKHINNNGGVDMFACESPVLECPHKSKVKSKNGTAASGQGLKVEHTPIGGGGDMNTQKFKVKYTCTYYWTQR